MGLVELTKVTNLFFKDSSLSSLRPEVAPRSKQRLMQAFSLHSKLRTNLRLTLSPMASFQPVKLSSFLGNPSMRKSFLSDSFIALSSKEQVMATGTMVPLVMCCSISSPYCDPSLLRSCRSKSPVKKEVRFSLYNLRRRRLDFADRHLTC